MQNILPQEVVSYIQSQEDFIKKITSDIKSEKKQNHFNYKENEYLSYLSYMIISITTSKCKSRIWYKIIENTLNLNSRKISLYKTISERIDLITSKSNKKGKSTSYYLTNKLKSLIDWETFLLTNETYINEIINDINLVKKNLYNQNIEDDILSPSNELYIKSDIIYHFPDNYSLHSTYITKYEEIIQKYKSKADSIKDKSSDKYIGLLNYYLITLPNSIKSILDGNYNLSISEVNGRRESLFTTLNKELCKYETIDDKITMSLDFTAMQPTAYANKYKNKVDNNFYLHTTTGIFYEILGNKMKQYIDSEKPDKEYGKSLWQNIAYWQEGYINESFENEITKEGYNKYHKYFYLIYPKTAKHLDRLKTQYANVANHITKLESNIINPLSDYLFENGIKNRTNRDEIRFKVSDKEQVMYLVEKYLLSINYDGKLKLTKPLEINLK